MFISPRWCLLGVCLATCCSCWASGATLSEHATDKFDAYVTEFGRQYERGSSEYAQRRALFEQRSHEVRTHNARPGGRWQARAGEFADRTSAERAAVRGWRRKGALQTQGGVLRPGVADGASLLALDVRNKVPKSADYRFLKTASKVLDQHECGSCWAATTGAVLEAHYELHHGTPRSFSVQEILSCTPNPRQCGGQGGCQGATVELGMQWALENGISDEEHVPYEAQDMDCPRKSVEEDIDLADRDRSKHKGRSLGMVGWQTLPINKAHPLMQAVIEWGPVAISVSGDRWHEYGGGVFDGCPKDVVIDHAVTLYGYGEDDQKGKYWLIRNTWGPHWGENGYIRVLRHDEGELYCGTDTDYQQGVGCMDEETTQVEVCGMCGLLSDSVVPHFAGAKNLSRADVPQWLLGDRPDVESLAAAGRAASSAMALGDGVATALDERSSRGHKKYRETHTAHEGSVLRQAEVGADAVPRILRREPERREVLEHGSVASP